MTSADKPAPPRFPGESIGGGFIVGMRFGPDERLFTDDWPIEFDSFDKAERHARAMQKQAPETTFVILAERLETRIKPSPKEDAA